VCACEWFFKAAHTLYVSLYRCTANGKVFREVMSIQLEHDLLGLLDKKAAGKEKRLVEAIKRSEMQYRLELIKEGEKLTMIMMSIAIKAK